MKNGKGAERVIPPLPKVRFTKKYENKWVVLSKDYKKVLAVGEDLSDVVKRTSGVKEKVVSKVLPPLGYLPTCV